jgi:hypothetical protein
MFLIVARKRRGGRRHVTNVGIERGPLHGRSRNRVLTDHSTLGSWQIDDQAPPVRPASRRRKTPLPLVCPLGGTSSVPVGYLVGELVGYW